MVLIASASIAKAPAPIMAAFPVGFKFRATLSPKVMSTPGSGERYQGQRHEA
jgi:hypothetical protein